MDWGAVLQTYGIWGMLLLMAAYLIFNHFQTGSKVALVRVQAQANTQQTINRMMQQANSRADRTMEQLTFVLTRYDAEREARYKQGMQMLKMAGQLNGAKRDLVDMSKASRAMMGKMSKLEGRVAQLEGQVADLERDLADRDALIAELQKQLADRDNKIEQLKAQLEEKSREENVDDGGDSDSDGSADGGDGAAGNGE